MTNATQNQLMSEAEARALTLGELKKKLKLHGIPSKALVGGIQDKLRELRKATDVDAVAFLIQGDPRGTVKDVAIRARNRINRQKGKAAKTHKRAKSDNPRQKATRPRKRVSVAPADRPRCLSFAGFNERAEGKYEATATLVDMGPQSPRYVVRIEWFSTHDSYDAASDAFHARCNVLRRAV